MLNIVHMRSKKLMMNWILLNRERIRDPRGKEDYTSTAEKKYMQKTDRKGSAWWAEVKIYYCDISCESALTCLFLFAVMSECTRTGRSSASAYDRQLDQELYRIEKEQRLSLRTWRSLSASHILVGRLSSAT